MASALLELGFLTNEEDNTLFDRYLPQYAEAAARGSPGGGDRLPRLRARGRAAGPGAGDRSRAALDELAAALENARRRLGV